jgi:hypothetical protein
MVEEVKGGDNSTNSKNTYLDRKAIHIHGRMKHNMVGYAKYYFYGSTKISNSEFIRKNDYNIRDFFGHW